MSATTTLVDAGRTAGTDPVLHKLSGTTRHRSLNDARIALETKRAGSTNYFPLNATAPEQACS